MANTRSFIVCGSGNKLFALFRTVIYFITERNLSLFEDKLVEQFKVVETIKVLGRRDTEQEDNPFAIEELKLQGKIKEDLTSSRRILHSLNKMENILMEIELTLQGMDGMCDEKVSDQKLTDQNLYTLEDIVNVDSNYNLGVKSVACVPEEQEEHNNASLDQTEYLQFMSTVNLAYPNHRSDIVQSLLTAIQKDLKDIPIHGRNLALRAHLAGHQDRLKRSRGSALQKAVLEFQQCMCRNEGPNGNQDQPVGLNEPMEIGVSKDVILKKQESEKDVRKDDQPEEKCPEEVCPERDSWSKEVEKSKLEMALEELYDKIDIGFESKSKKLEERIRDMLEASFDPLYLTNFNKCNEVPPDTRGHEKTLSVLQNLQRDFTRHQEDVQRWRMQEECNGDLASEEINMYRLEKENEKILRQLEEKEEILLELEEEKAEILRELEEEREHSKEQINKMAEERVEMNNLKEQNRIQMEENEKILRKLEEEKEEILLELEEERERSKEQINKMAEERVEMHNLKEQNRIQMEENEKILRKLEEEKAEILRKLEEEKAEILRKLEEEKAEILRKLEEEKAEILRQLEEEREHSKEQINKMAEERVKMNDLKEQNRIQMEENEKILRKLEEEKADILRQLEEEREHSKEQINKMAEERVKMNDLKEQNRIQMEENEKILRKLEEEKAEILRQLEEEREHSKEQINKMAEERVKMNDLKEQNRIQMEENEKILRKLEEEKAEILRQLEEEREHSKEQINKMAEERVKMNDLKEQNRIQMEENEKILRKLEEEKAEILLELEEEREHSKEQINKMAEERVKMNNLKEQNRIQMEENEKILRKLEEEKAEILLELEEERERSKEQISKMAEEIVEISRLKKENEVHLEEKEKILRKLEEEKGKILRELVEEGEHSKEKKGQTKEERKMNRLKRVNEIFLEDRQNIIHELEVEREHMRDKVGEIRQLKDELFMKECELMETRSELGCWIVELLEEEGLIDDVNRREGQLRDMVETIRGSNECLTNKLDKQHDPNTKIENIGEDLLKLESILLEETEDHRKPTDQNLEDTFEVESVAYVPEETKEQHYDTNSSGTERVHFLGTEKHSHLDLRSNIVQDLLNGIQNRLREIPIEQKNMPLRAHLAGHQVLLKRAKGSALQKAVLKFQQCWCPNERPKSKQKQPTGPNEPKEIEFLEEKKEYVAMEAFHNKMDAKVTYEINRVEERTQDMINARMETFRRKIEEELLVHPTSYKNFSNEVPADEEGQEKLLSIAQNLQRDFSHYMEDIQRWQLQRRSKGDLRSEEKVEISRLKKENEVHLEEKEKILRELEEKEK
ncbi:golgin subfamily A member 6-like protein 22, partial [Palaemon carinicauda]|uniref:golgin subfamily A member 6-like protein 22 n=1 Tax=Palaemon carinicauda TaxID=392227 RepID=UPI0035B60A8D